MRRQGKLALGGVAAAAAVGAYLYWVHDWRPSCSDVPSAAAAAEWLNSLASAGKPFTPDFVACAAIATFYEDRGGNRGRDQYSHPGIGIHYATPPRPEDFAKLKDLPRLEAMTFLATKAESGYADALAASLGQYKALKVIEWKFGAGMTDAGLRHLAGLAKLEMLELNQSTLSGDGVAALAKLPVLREVALWNSKIDGSGMPPLAGLRAVQRLNLYFAEVEGSLGPIARMPALQRLKISGTDLTEAQVASLAGAPELAYLELSGVPIGPSGFAAIGSMPKLRVLLVLKPTQVSGIERLASSASLTSLALIEATLEDGTGLGAARTLKGVDLSGSKVSNTTIAAMAELTSMERLFLNEAKITDEALRLLAKAPQLTELTLVATPITDAGLAHLAAYPKLRKVYLAGTKVTDAGVAKLKSAKPDLEIGR